MVFTKLDVKISDTTMKGISHKFRSIAPYQEMVIILKFAGQRLSVNKRDQIVKRDCAKYIYFAPFQCVNLSMYIINYSTLSDKYVASGR